MFQYLAPLPTRKKHGDQFLASKTFPDHAAIPVKLFNPLIKRDALPGKGTRGGISVEDEEDAEDEGWLQYVAERDLGDGSAGHPIAGRYLATDAYAGPDDLDGLDSNHIAMAASTAGGTSLRDMIDLSRMSPSNASTASSVPLAQAQPRRQSTRIAMHASSGTGTGTNNDPIAIDDDGHAPDTRAAAASKGTVTVKAEVVTKANRQGEETDDESSESSSSSEEEEGTRRKPPAKRPRVAGKATVKRTGGKAPAKAPARKTVSGKAVARKGGKSIKGVRR
jgi:mediator of RNA polymerase II transcription subunit 12